MWLKEKRQVLTDALIGGSKHCYKSDPSGPCQTIESHMRLITKT